MSATPPETYAAATADDFLDRILSTPSYTDDGRGGTLLNDERFVETTSSMVSSQLSSGDGAAVFTGNGSTFPLDLSLGVQFPNARVVSGRGSLVNSEGQFVPLANLLPQAGHIHHHPVQQTDPHVHQVFHGQTFSGAVGAAQNSPGIRPKVRARRGQATDPHSIAERLRRERITERVKALQEIVPSCNKTDRAAMLDEVLDYVKFLRLQVKVLSMSRLGGAGAVAQLVTENPEVSAQGDAIEDGIHQQVWEKWSNDGTEQEVARLMEKDIGAAMQFLQSKALCIMPISLAAAVFPSPQLDVSGHVKPELNAP